MPYFRETEERMKELFKTIVTRPCSLSKDFYDVDISNHCGIKGIRLQGDYNHHKLQKYTKLGFAFEAQPNGFIEASNKYYSWTITIVLT